MPDSANQPLAADPGGPPDPPAPPDEAARIDATQDMQLGGDEAARLVELLDGYLSELKAGKQPDRQQLLKDHPDLAVQLETCLAGIDFIHSGHAAGQPAGRRLGDFRILREVGHGGMGAVYEAEQLSLGRRVALKVLRFGPVSDAAAIQRFQREAETVARLHHTNIVPIFAVGSEGGVNYYAMQFIVGRSLDQVLRDTGGPIAWRKVAEWGLQAAEALAHAHARGVIHRDVKPSNLLIDDAEGRIWLTDFGLAKRLDDVTLSLTGALLGTPRYMSPEQAAAKDHKIDHRTDLYSLGATLYELATGQPVFAGESPHNVISQILTSDPVSPRRLVPSLPRDLNTILIKCLAKDPRDRYASAQHLAEDLRALLDGRPIAARRASLLEVAARWLQRQKRNAAISTAAAAGTLAVVVAAALGGHFWHRARLASLMLKTDHPPLIAELLDSHGAPVAPPATVPTLQELEIPAGDYRLRVSAEGRMSQTFDLHLHRGEKVQKKLDLEDQVLWQDRNIDGAYRLAHIKTKEATAGKESAVRTDIISLTELGIECAAGDTGSKRWSLNLSNPDKPLLKEARLLWPWNATGTSSYQGVGDFDGQPMMVSAKDTVLQDSADFNGDGTSDLVIAARHQAWLLAVSGSDGEPLWLVRRGEAAQESEQRTYAGTRSAVLYPPTAVPDQDGDGALDLTASFIFAGREGTIQRWVELVSGASGKSLWRFDLTDELFQLPNQQPPPYGLRWFYGSGGGYSSGGQGWQRFGDYLTRSRGHLERSGEHAYAPGPPTVVGEDAGFILTMVAGTKAIAVDLRTGKEKWPAADLGVRPSIETKSGDFDGDGHADLLLTEQLPPKVVAGGQVARGSVPQTRLTAWSPTKKSLLWQHTIEAELPRQQQVQLPEPAWPVVGDLDGDQIAEVLVPDESTKVVGSSNTAAWGTVTLLEGRAGRPRWKMRIRNMDQQLDCFLAGPDINGDKIGEVYVTSLWGRSFDLYVDCLSGSDGQCLWRTHQPLLHKSEAGQFFLANLSWHDAGSDGWPQLVVPARAQEGDVRDRVCLFSAGTGEATHIGLDVTEATSADLDADGTSDLVMFRRNDDYNWDRGGILHSQRGIGQEPWRAIAPPQIVVGDLDGDGVRDLVSEPKSDTLTAQSGASGKLLWRKAIDSGYVWERQLHPAQSVDPRRGTLPVDQDLNGDGTPDLLLVTGRTMSSPQPIVRALSGKTGNGLWESEFFARVISSVPLLECRDLDGDGAAEVILAAACDYHLSARASYGNTDAQLWLAVLSGSDGRLRWAAPLSRASPTQQSPYELDHLRLEAGYADLDGDKVLDVLLPCQATSEGQPLEMRAYRGSNGQSLWGVPLLADQYPQKHFAIAAPPAAGDIDGDRQQEVAFVSFGQSSDDQGPGMFVNLTLVEGASGKPRWTWQTRVDRWGTEMHQQRNFSNRLRPVLLRRADGQHWIGLLTWNMGRQIHVFNPQGEIIAKRLDKQQEEQHAGGSRLWPLDADGDGNDEIVLLTKSGLSLLPPDQLESPIWQRTEPALTSGWVVGVLPDVKAVGRLVMMGGHPDNSLRGLDPQTGHTLWTCLGNSAPLEVAEYAGNHAPLNSPDRDTPAFGYFRYGDTALVRAAMAEPDPSFRETWQTAARVPARTDPAEYDPRLLRPLPWKPLHQVEAQPVVYLTWSLFYGLTLVAMPLVYAGHLVRRRRWSLKTMLALPAVCGVFLLGVIVHGPEHDFRHFTGKLVVGAFFAGPLLFAAATLIRWTWQRRWPVLLSWAGAFAALVLLALGSGLLSFDPSASTPLEPGERWDWSGWYWVLPPALFITAWAMTILVPIAWLVTAVRARAGIVQPHPSKQLV